MKALVSKKVATRTIIFGSVLTAVGFVALMLDVFNAYGKATSFIDDDAANVGAATNLGMNGVVYTTPAQLISDLRQFIPDLELSQAD